MEPIKRVMMDLETLGSGPTAAIVSIGVVKMTDRILDTFYVVVDAASCVEAGLVMDVPTIQWWLRQSQEARNSISSAEAALPLRHALGYFREWLGDWGGDEDVEFWGNGANFDNVILASAYSALRMERPWKYFQDRCFRTLKKLHPEVPAADRPESGKHNALEDALHQAEHLLRIYAKRLASFELLESAIADFEKLQPFHGEAALATAQLCRDGLKELRNEPPTVN